MLSVNEQEIKTIIEHYLSNPHNIRSIVETLFSSKEFKEVMKDSLCISFEENNYSSMGYGPVDRSEIKILLKLDNEEISSDSITIKN